MKTLLSALLVLTVGCAEEWVTYENTHFGYELSHPSDFEVRERLVHPLNDRPGKESQTVNLVAWNREPVPVLEVNVNGYDSGYEPKTIYVFYDFAVQEDGTVALVDRWLDIPEDGYNAVRAVSLFIDPTTGNVHSFNMELWDDHEALFVDVVSSFRFSK